MSLQHLQCSLNSKIKTELLVSFLTRGGGFYCLMSLIKPVNLGLLSNSFCVVLVCEALFDLHDQFHTPLSDWPSVLQPSVPVWAYQPDKNLCLLPRNSAPGGCGGDRSFLSGLIYSLPGAWNTSQGQPGGFLWERCQQLQSASSLLPPTLPSFLSGSWPNMELTVWIQADQNCMMAAIWGALMVHLKLSMQSETNILSS